MNLSHPDFAKNHNTGAIYAIKHYQDDAMMDPARLVQPDPHQIERNNRFNLDCQVSSLDVSSHAKSSLTHKLKTTSAWQSPNLRMIPSCPSSQPIMTESTQGQQSTNISQPPGNMELYDWEMVIQSIDGPCEN